MKKVIAIIAMLIVISFLFIGAVEMRPFGDPDPYEEEMPYVEFTLPLEYKPEEEGEIEEDLKNKIIEEDVYLEEDRWEDLTVEVYEEEDDWWVEVDGEKKYRIEETDDDLEFYQIKSMDDHFLQDSQRRHEVNNVVTAVLFDYRGLDTLGEATILFTAVSGVLTVLRKFRKEKEEVEE